MKIEVSVVHTVYGLRIQLLDADAQHFNEKYRIYYGMGDAPGGPLRLFISPVVGLGVRPGAPRDRKKQPSPVRYLQFQPLLDYVPEFGRVPATIESDERLPGFIVTLPPRDQLPEPVRYKRGPDKEGPRVPTPNLDPVPLAITETASVGPVSRTVRTEYADRINIRDAVRRVNEFLRDTPGASLSLFSPQGEPDRIKIEVVECYE